MNGLINYHPTVIDSQMVPNNITKTSMVHVLAQTMPNDASGHVLMVMLLQSCFDCINPKRRSRILDPAVSAWRFIYRNASLIKRPIK